jgi:Arm DNA-binding domain/Phage integrase, N-terminal SAM-like domain
MRGDTQVIPGIEADDAGKDHETNGRWSFCFARAPECTLWDTEIKGFGVRARRGGAKTYILYYRAGRGRVAPLRKITIGKHGSPWTPETARTEARRLMGQVASGGDPCLERAADKKAITLAELCDLYLTEGTAHKKPSTIRIDKGRIEHHIKPPVGRKRVNALTRGDIERLLVDVKEGKTAARRSGKSEKRPAGSLPTGGAGAAAQCVTLVSALLAFAVKSGLREETPPAGSRSRLFARWSAFCQTTKLLGFLQPLSSRQRLQGTPTPVPPSSCCC